ncbi:MAG: phosphorylase [Moorea sp. SIO4G2]|nr:phosphorylase [Moorena sp. SIO4G2]
MTQEQPIAEGTLVLEPGTLWPKLKAQTEHAIECKALHSIATEYEFVEQDGIRFLVRILSNLVRKDKAKKKQEEKTATSSKDFNPFLPYEQDLFVADLSDTHLCLLNKYNVVDHHLLIITRAFEEQDTWLTLQDFAAMWACLAEIDGLAFYNAGKIGGASQRHKHLQLVPLPLAPEGVNIPIENAIASASFQDSVGTIPTLPFIHAIVQLDPSWVKSPWDAAQATLKLYHRLLSAVGLPWNNANGNKQSGAYNLLATRQWMLLLPRSQADFQSIGVNSLGFAGALLVRNQEQMKRLKDHGPMTILRNVAVNW